MGNAAHNARLGDLDQPLDVQCQPLFADAEEEERNRGTRLLLLTPGQLARPLLDAGKGRRALKQSLAGRGKNGTVIAMYRRRQLRATMVPLHPNAVPAIVHGRLLSLPDF